MKKIFLISVILFLSIMANAQKEEPREFEFEEGDTTWTMKRYVLCIYLRGERAQDYTEEELKELQKGHLAHINKMGDAGIVHLAGPFGDDTEKRGILIMDLETVEEAVEWLEEDPLVQAGRLTYELHPWWGAKGSCLK